MAGAGSGRLRHRIAKVVAVAIVAVTGMVAPALTATPAYAAGFSAALARAPYLTDLTGLHVNVNWATDKSATVGSLTWGPVLGGVCQLTSTATASRVSVTIGALARYQWKVPLNLPATGTYCYRPYLATTDLLGTEASPAFTTQEQAGSTDPFSFAVFGDWGMVDASGVNAEQTGVISGIAQAGVRFAVTVGDNGYPSGSQTNYGDLQQTGANTSAIFGPNFWTLAGPTVPLFTAVGNHGLSGTAHTDIKTWTQDTVVAESGGRYQNDVYCCVNGTFSSNYGSEWYAFDAGPARFYILDSAWGDTNKGTANSYANDYAAHFTPGTPEYEWLKHDLETHPRAVKFAFSHFPFYSDSGSELSDTYLQGPNSLEGLLGSNGVDLVFNGHAHIYQRNLRSAPGMPATYVTGGGGAKVGPLGPCSAIDAYAIGWSNSKAKGYACGAAAVPTSKAQVFHFLKVTVAGSTITVEPTDSTGQTFDVQTYDLSASTPETGIDSAPPAATTETTATIAFSATSSPATFACAVDGTAAVPCTSPLTLASLTEGPHSVAVQATTTAGTDPTPAIASWQVDLTAPAAPIGLAASPGPGTVQLTWQPVSDPSGIDHYTVARDGAQLTTTGGVQFTDAAVTAGETYTYSVSATDAAGNQSAASESVPATVPEANPTVFSDGFESGTLSAWTTRSGLTVQSAETHSGVFAARATTTNGATYAKKTLPAEYADAYARVWFKPISTESQVNILRFRAANGTSLGYLYVTPTGALAYRNEAAGTVIATGATIDPGSGWHALELHTTTAGLLEVWVDGVSVLSTTTNLSTSPVGQFQIGEVNAGRTYDVVFDDAAFATTRVGP
ncbi:metallophosphoesterase [Agromyces neolithicus]|uniref:Fibronectin type-III domain-containing protein n=1 Tax=Agromyces neolithicus TaxID=269420 RepID=A0ABN2M8N5_9MICO